MRIIHQQITTDFLPALKYSIAVHWEVAVSELTEQQETKKMPQQSTYTQKWESITLSIRKPYTTTYTIYYVTIQ